MPYTLAKWALWLIAAAVIGLVVGWMLRGVRRASAVPATQDELAEPERLRVHVEDTDRLARERERLRIELDDCRATAAASRVAGWTAVVSSSAVPSAPAEPLLPSDGDRARLSALVVEQKATIGDLRARLWNHEAKIGELQSALTAYILSTAPRDPDLEHGAEVLGEKVRLNDLTVIEGIGPKIADMLQTTGGIKTWWELHRTEVATLRTLLDGAGPRFGVHDPASWPQQAGLLARGEWAMFKELTTDLQGGKLQG